MTYSFLKNDMPVIAILLMLCFFTCTNTKEPIEYDTVQMSPPISHLQRFDSMLNADSIRCDSQARVFDSTANVVKQIKAIKARRLHELRPAVDTITDNRPFRIGQRR